MPDFLEPERYRLYLFQSGLGLPNSDYYTDDSEQGRAIVAAYHSYMRDVYMAWVTAGMRRIKPPLQAGHSNWAWRHHRPPEKDRNYPLWHNLYGPGHKTCHPA